MATPFKVLIIGGGMAGLSLAIILEEYGFEYELLEKHADVAPRLGAGVGLTPNGARILDQIGVWDLMCESGSPINSGTAISPEGRSVLHNPSMGETMKELFGYKIQFVSRYNALNILYNRIRDKSRIHKKQELTKVETIGTKVRVETKDGSIFTADLLIGADGVRSYVRQELWRIADSEKPGYIPEQDKTAIESTYRALVGVAKDMPDLPQSESVRAYNYDRSYFYQKERESTGEVYWWLCEKNAKKAKGTIRGFPPKLKQHLVDKYKDDVIWPSVTFEDLYKRSFYSAVIPLEEYVLEKVFYKNIFLMGDAFRKLHPVTGMGANSAFEESALVADFLWDLREKKALHDPVSLQQAFSDFQKQRYTRLVALRDDAHLVQQLESFDNPVLRFMSLHVIPNLSFESTFMPVLGSSFAAAQTLKHLPPPTAGTWPFAPEIKIKPGPRSSLATGLWTAVLLLAASSPWWISNYLLVKVEGNNHGKDLNLPLTCALQLYSSAIAVSISGLWITESYRADSLVSLLASALPYTLLANRWGWEKIFPIYLSFHIKQSQGIYYYYMPRTITDLGAAKFLLPALVLVYTIPIFQSFSSGYESVEHSWKVAHSALPLVVYSGSRLLNIVTTIPRGVDVVFHNKDIPYQNRFWNPILLLSGSLHVFLALIYGPQIFNGGAELLFSPLVRRLSSLIAVSTIWCLYTAWELGRVDAVDISVVEAWGYILFSTIVGGPAAALAGTWSWRASQLAKARSSHHDAGSLDKMANGSLLSGHKVNGTR
ncbi:hypothetical protein B0O99DRAFT_597462 [Bisporella sp. PMI_857]|nr:hypothetical protein B0O99DRAFT_597462 [Bisporella sp. PMI_857]